MPLTVPVGETAPVGAQAMALAGEMATTPVLDGATVPVTALETALARETAPALAQDGAKAQAPAGAPAVAGETATATVTAAIDCYALQGWNRMTYDRIEQLGGEFDYE